MKKIAFPPGTRFGRLTVERQAKKAKGPGTSHWLCLCDCGTEIIVRASKLKDATVRSCGCLRRTWAITHKMTNHPVYRKWRAMRTRCENPRQNTWKNYGGRGIKVCERWLKFENFLADMGIPEKGLTLDRINNDGNYEPSNCRWADMRTQRLNQRRMKPYHEGISS